MSRRVLPPVLLALLIAGGDATAQSVHRPIYDPLATFSTSVLCSSRPDTVLGARRHVIEVMQSEDSTAQAPVHYERQASFSFDSLGSVKAVQFVSSELAGDSARTIAIRASFEASRGYGTRTDGLLHIRPTVDSTGEAVLGSRVDAIEDRALTERELEHARRTAEALWLGACRNGSRFVDRTE